MPLNWEQTVWLVLAAIVGLFLFSVYFVLKVLGFFLAATRLYKQMINRLDVTIKLLADIRDDTKTASVDSQASEAAQLESPASGSEATNDDDVTRLAYLLIRCLIA